MNVPEDQKGIHTWRSSALAKQAEMPEENLTINLIG